MAGPLSTMYRHNLLRKNYIHCLPTKIPTIHMT